MLDFDFWAVWFCAGDRDRDRGERWSKVGGVVDRTVFVVLWCYVSSKVEEASLS